MNEKYFASNKEVGTGNWQCSAYKLKPYFNIDLQEFRTEWLYQSKSMVVLINCGSHSSVTVIHIGPNVPVLSRAKIRVLPHSKGQAKIVFVSLSIIQKRYKISETVENFLPHHIHLVLNFTFACSLCTHKKLRDNTSN